jgi:hypothetical protein
VNIAGARLMLAVKLSEGVLVQFGPVKVIVPVSVPVPSAEFGWA